MNSQKKLGTFGGVFTPSILTILGVIMYMRLPWIVGQAGLYMTIGIILVAHVISITTGMSVASIATDKRVKTGGTYYMISRSLGLPIGGTLGLALFVGLSFSVSLYLIGFSESLLSFAGIEVSKQMIRITGTIALVLVATITFISTSLAIKTQFFIMIAIILSLGSIFLGNHSFTPQQPLLNPIMTSAPFIVLFGIFFPAVTGFESGVSMSGDLQDPKRAIPIGTILAIIVGLIVYIGLAVFFSFTVQAEQLVNNTKVLMDISLFPQVVVAGIWGATISSALGSILGAPRILQATSIDRITPQFFGKGYGKENEPRHALLLTFLIAEAGILIGELDVIARIVSMFFITTYGFLNMSCAIESWASPDFRPDFKIPKIISIIGAITCFIVMIQLDLIAMIGAVVILSGIFFYLKRKELALESGDTWEGVWSSLIRAGLHRLNLKETHQRNWRPNIVLFSGGTLARPHLIELGKWLVDKRGILSNFDLVENPNLKKVLYRKSEQAVKDETENFSGVFTRRIECIDKYECMSIISKYYGFSGIEPNTVLMGWAHNTQNPEKLIQVLKGIIDLDYNLMLLNFGDSRGFGNHERIDVWWRGAGSNFALAIALIRYLTTTSEWHNATIRFLTITEESTLTEKLLDNMNRILSEYRIEGTVKIINNAVKKKAFREIIQKESEKADLIINGIPEIKDDNAMSFIETTSETLQNLGVTLLIRAASFFDKISIVDDSNLEVLKEIQPELEIQEPGMHLKTDHVPNEISPHLVNFFNRVKDMNATLETTCLKELYGKNRSFIRSVDELLQSNFETLEKKINKNDRQRNHRQILKAHSDILFHLQKVVSDFSNEGVLSLQNLMTERISWLSSQMPLIVKDLPVFIHTDCPPEDLFSAQTKSISFRCYRNYKKIMSVFTNNKARYKIKFSILSDSYLKKLSIAVYKEALKRFAVSCHLTARDLNNVIDAMMDTLGMIEKQQLVESGPVFHDFFEAEKKRFFERIEKINLQCQEDLQESILQMNRGTLKVMYTLIGDLQKPDVNFLSAIKKKEKWKTLLEREFETVSEIWADNFKHVLNLTDLDLTLLLLKRRLRTLSNRLRIDFQLSLQNNCTEKFKSAERYLASYLETERTDKLKLPVSFREKVDINEIFESMKREIQVAIENLPEDREVISMQIVNQIMEHPFQPVEPQLLSLNRLVEYLVETEFIGPMHNQSREIAGIIQKGNDIGQDVVRLISLNQDDMESTGGSNSAQAGENLKSIFAIAATRITEGRTMFETLQENQETNLNQYLGNVLDRLNLYSITQAGETLPHYFREKQGKKVISQFEGIFQFTLKRVTEYYIKMLYQKHSKTFAEGGQDKNIKTLSPVEAVVDIVDAVSPSRSVLTALPFYYRHLFLGKPPVTKEFWVGRKTEILSAEKSILRYRSGVGGGLMIVGEPGAGKTALSQYIATKYFDKQNIYIINPPNEGSIDISIFKNRLKNTLQLKGDYSEIFSRLTTDSVIIFNEIELWWERSEKGFEVINLLQNLIRQYSGNCFFILNTNIHTYRLMNRLKKIEDSFFDVIPCSPIAAEPLKDIVLLRHHATGMIFHHNNKPQEILSELNLTKLFVHLHKESEGNVGVMLQNWIRCIREINKDTIMIDTLPDSKMEAFSRIDDLHLVLSGQLILHKRLSRDRISRIMQIAVPETHQYIDALKRYGLLLENFQNVYEINPYIQPYLIKFLKQKGIL